MTTVGALGYQSPAISRNATSSGRWSRITRNPDLLFCGTEFGLYFTIDGGSHWTKLGGGLPTIAVRDIAVQRRENDLVLGTFGRSFWVLDDYTPLRQVNEHVLAGNAHLFPIRDAWRYIETSDLGLRTGRGSQGAAYYAAPNPPFGAVVTYWLGEKLQSRAEERAGPSRNRATRRVRRFAIPPWRNSARRTASAIPKSGSSFVTLADRLSAACPARARRDSTESRGISASRPSSPSHSPRAVLPLRGPCPTSDRSSLRESTVSPSR